MKKLLILLPVMFIVTLVFPNNLSWFSHNQFVKKDITVSLFSTGNYGSAAYDDATAMVEVTVSKKDENGITILGKRSFSALQLKQYPSAAKAISNKMQIAGNVKSNEMLMVTYTITYDTRGSLVKFQNSQVMSKESVKDNVNITI